MTSREDRLMELACTLRVWALLSPENLTFGLIELCQENIKPDCVMVEVGSFSGVSTEVFAIHAKMVYAVEPFDPELCHPITPDMNAWAYRKFLRMYASYRNIDHLRMTSMEAVKRWKECSLDAVYIDGNHDRKEFTEDLEAWRPKIKQGGLLMGHDYIPGEESERRGNYIAKVLQERGMVPDKIYPETSWVIRV